MAMEENLNGANIKYSEKFSDTTKEDKSLLPHQNNVISDRELEMTTTMTSLFSNNISDNLPLFRKQVEATLKVCQQFYDLLNDEGDSSGTEVSRINNSSLNESSEMQELKKELIDMKQKLDAERLLRAETLTSNQSSLDLLVAENQKLKDELKACEVKLKAAEEVISDQLKMSKSSVDEKQYIALLEAQLKMFRDDFESERKDRERAQVRLETVAGMFSLAKKQLEQYERQSKSSCNKVLQDRITSQRHDGDCVHVNSRPLMSRGVYETDTELCGVEGSDIISLVSTPTDTRSPATHCNSADVSASRRKSELLCCPRCMKEFYIDNHSDLVEHIEQCHN